MHQRRKYSSPKEVSRDKRNAYVTNCQMRWSQYDGVRDEKIPSLKRSSDEIPFLATKKFRLENSLFLQCVTPTETRRRTGITRIEGSSLPLTQALANHVKFFVFIVWLFKYFSLCKSNPNTNYIYCICGEAKFANTHYTKGNLPTPII